MSDIDVTITDASTGYRPGDVVHATATWTLPAAPEGLVARLLWTTQGRGTTDTSVVASVDAAVDTGPAAAHGEWRFELVVPVDAPSSYGGKLLSVRWTVEVVAGRDFGQADLKVSATGRTLRPPSP